MDLKQRKVLLTAARPFINRHLFDRSLGIVAHDGMKPLEHGTGMLLGLEEGPVIVTAAHVIKPFKREQLQFLTTERPSNFLAAPTRLEFLGGETFGELDLGFLQPTPMSVRLLDEKKCIRLEELDVFPTDLSSDLAICFGLPEAIHQVQGHNIHCYNTFTYLTNIPDEFDWNGEDKPSNSIFMEYPKAVEDVFTGRWEDLPEPYGMSGGGMWRVTFKCDGLWTLDQVRLIGINTEFYAAERFIRANRVEALLEFLSPHFPSVARFLAQAREEFEGRRG